MNFDELWGKSTPNSWARVPRGPLAAAVGTFLFGSTGFMATTGIAGVSLATMTGFLITTAVTTWAMAALAPRPDMGSTRGQLTNGREAAGAFDIVYGEVRKGGVVTFMESTDRIGYKVFKNDYLHSIIVLAGHEVEEIGDIYLNDEVVTLDANGFVTGDRWKSLVRIKKHLGSPTQVADPDLVAETSVTSAFRGRGIAYLYVRMDWDKDVFAGGTPTITAQVKGRKVYDPRTGTTAWSNNAALCIRDYLEQPFGVNSIQSPSSLLSNSWNIGANVSDQAVALAAGGSERRYTINGIVSTANSPRTNIQKMLTACGGTLFWGQGQWQFKAGYLPSGPYMSLDAGDLRSGISLVTRNSRKENFNAVTGIFVDKNQRYTEVEYPKFSSAVFLARDNGQENILDVSLPYTVTASAAQRLAKMAMFRNREEIVISADFSLKTTDVKVGDVVQFSFDRYGFVNKLFEVITWKPVSDNGELKINLVLKETSAAAYDWNGEERDIIGNDSVLPNPLDGLSVSNLVVTNNQVLQADGTLIGQVTLSWNEAESAFIDHYDVQWKKNTDATWSATTTTEGSIVLPSIVAGILYNYRVRAVTLAGFSGPWESTSVNVPGKTTPPGTPTNFTATGAYRSINLKWTNPTDRDLNHVEVWAGTTNVLANATLLGRSGGTTFIDGPVTPMTEKWYWIRAVDHSDNKSPYSPSRNATALFVEDTDIDIDVKELLEDAGLSAVEVLGALPTTGNFVGRTVYLTTDQQIYVWNGTSWDTVASEFDGILEAANFPNNLRPIEFVTSLPTTGNFNGRVVFLNTNGKLYRYTGGAWTSATAATDLTGTLTTTQIGPNTIQTGNLAAGAVQADQLDANAVTAGKIAAFAIAADNLQSNIIAARHMLIGDLTNYVPDADINDPASWTIPAAWTRTVAGDAFQGAYQLAADGGSSASPAVVSKQFSVDTGEDYYVSVQARSNGAGQSVDILCLIRWFKTDGTFISQNNVKVGGTGNLTTAVTKYENSVTAPTGATRAQFYWQVTAGSSGRAVVASPTVRRKNNGKLIVDGSILAQHMTANSITAGVIAAGAINATALFVDGVITAAKLNVNQLSAISANLGTITAGSINIGSGKFVVNSNGDTTIRSGTTGERLVITNNRIDVYDSSGTLRVRLGQL